jgi:HK97 family phage major capsid protein
MVVNVPTAPELTAEQVQRILVQPLEAASVFLASQPRIFDSNGSQIRVPKLGGPIDDPGWTGESEPIPEKDADFDEVVLLPSTMKSVKVITRFSNELARQSVVSLDAALRDRLVRDVAMKLDKQFLGSGGDGITTPMGMLAWPGTQSVDAAGVAASLDMLHDAWGKALSGNVEMSRLRWFMRPDSFVGIKKLKDTQNRYQLQPDPTQDGVFRLLGAPVTITPNLPLDTESQKTIVLADFSQIAVARDLAPSVTVLRERYADYDEQALRVVARYDTKPLNAEAVVKILNLV